MSTPATEHRVDASLLFSAADAPDEAELYSCVHCGFCLQAWRQSLPGAGSR